MKNVLILGMDQVSSKTIAKVLREHDDFFQALVAGNSDEAIEISMNIKIDLLIVDFCQTELNTLEVLHFIKKSFPEILVIGITGNDTSLTNLKIEYPGITEYIKKPIDTNLLTETIFKALNISISGQINGIGLASFLQMVEMEEKTCSLKIKHNRNVGYLYFHNGELIAAETGALEDEEAAYEIIGWENARIEIFDSKNEIEKRIDSPLMNILIETLRIKDDKKNTESKVKKEKKPSKTTPAVQVHIGLEIGTRLHIKSENLAITIKSTFIGMEKDEYLIISTPRSFKKLQDDINQNKQIIVKYLFNGIIFAFKSRLIKTIPAPFNLLFLEYPKKIEHRYIRSLKRIKCFIPTKAKYKNEETIGSILDINIKGCGCLLQTLHEQESLLWKIEAHVSLKCRFPGREGEVEISGIIKNIRITNEGTVIGIAFYEKISSEVQEIIIEYIVSVGEFD